MEGDSQYSNQSVHDHLVMEELGWGVRSAVLFALTHSITQPLGRWVDFIFHSLQHFAHQYLHKKVDFVKP